MSKINIKKLGVVLAVTTLLIAVVLVGSVSAATHYTVTFDDGNTSASEKVLQAVSVTVGTHEAIDFPLPDESWTVPEGKVFAGWTVSTDGSGHLYGFKGQEPLFDDIKDGCTLHANWVSLTGDGSNAHPYEVTDYKTLAAAVYKAGMSGNGKDCNIKLMNDIDLTAHYAKMPYYNCARIYVFNDGVTLDLDGHTIDVNDRAAAYVGTNLTIKNGFFRAHDDASVEKGANYALNIGDEKTTYYDKVSSVTLDDVNCTGGINIYRATVDIKSTHGKTKIVGGPNYYTVYCAYDEDQDDPLTVPCVKISGGLYSSEYNGADSKSYGGLLRTESINDDFGHYLNSSTIEITGGTFVVDAAKYQTLAEGGEKVTLKGGMYSTKPDAKYVSDGYVVSANGDNQTMNSYPWIVQAAATTTATKSPFPIFGILAGLGAAALFLRRK